MERFGFSWFRDSGFCKSSAGRGLGQMPQPHQQASCNTSVAESGGTRPLIKTFFPFPLQADADLHFASCSLLCHHVCLQGPPFDKGSTESHVSAVLHLLLPAAMTIQLIFRQWSSLQDWFPPSEHIHKSSIHNSKGSARRPKPILVPETGLQHSKTFAKR